MDTTLQSTCSKCSQVINIAKEHSKPDNVCPHCGASLFANAVFADDPAGRDVYNIVSDIATGVNVRKKDNLYQLAAIGVGLLLGIAIGFFCTRDHATGAVLGGFIGLLAGLFGSGIFLMIYRFIRHIQGHH
jgi:hypothetical protein